jgi:hypothetical protein
MQINLSITVRAPNVRDVTVEVDATQLGPVPLPETIPTDWTDAHLDLPDGSTTRLFDHLTLGELSPLGSPPTPPHTVTRVLPDGTRLRTAAGSLPVRTLRATVGDSDSTATTVVGPGPEGVAHILKDAISGATVWLQTDGSIRAVP